ncbi:hypothetical protein HDV62DRAFT_256225 [Trichoderma sp. SZMC 28011]
MYLYLTLCVLLRDRLVYSIHATRGKAPLVNPEPIIAYHRRACLAARLACGLHEAASRNSLPPASLHDTIWGSFFFSFFPLPPSQHHSPITQTGAPHCSLVHVASAGSPHTHSLSSIRGVAKCQPAWRKNSSQEDGGGGRGQTLRTKGHQPVWLLVGRKRESRQHAT